MGKFFFLKGLWVNDEKPRFLAGAFFDFYSIVMDWRKLLRNGMLFVLMELGGFWA
jgi:hypothetical protein